MCNGISLNLHKQIECACCFVISTQPWLHLSRDWCRVEAFNCYSSLVSIIITHMFISGGVIIFLIIDCLQLIHLSLFSKINFIILYPKIKVAIISIMLTSLLLSCSLQVLSFRRHNLIGGAWILLVHSIVNGVPYSQT